MLILNNHYLYGVAALVLLFSSAVFAEGKQNSTKPETETQEITHASEIPPQVRFYLSPDPAQSVMTISTLVEQEQPAPDPDGEFNPGNVLGVVRTTWESKIYRVRDGVVSHFAEVSISRGWPRIRDRHLTYNINRDSRIMDLVFDGQQLIMLCSFVDGSLYLRTGNLDPDSGRVLEYSYLYLLTLDGEYNADFPHESDIHTDESGKPVVRVRVASADGEEPHTLATVPIAPSALEGDQQKLPKEQYKTLLAEYRK